MPPKETSGLNYWVFKEIGRY